MGFSRQYWSGLPFPFPGYLPDPGIKPGSPALQKDSLPSERPGKMYIRINLRKLLIDFETLPNNYKGDKNVWIKIEQTHILVKILFSSASVVGFCTEEWQDF